MPRVPFGLSYGLPGQGDDASEREADRAARAAERCEAERKEA